MFPVSALGGFEKTGEVAVSWLSLQCIPARYVCLYINSADGASRLAMACVGLCLHELSSDN